MEGVDERDRVNNSLIKAHELVKELPEGTIRTAALVAAYLTEAVVRQVRDLDDSVYHAREAITTSLNDLTVVLSGRDQ